MVQGLNRAAAFAAAAAARLRRQSQHSVKPHTQTITAPRTGANNAHLSPNTWVGTLALGVMEFSLPGDNGRSEGCLSVGG